MNQQIMYIDQISSIFITCSRRLRRSMFVVKDQNRWWKGIYEHTNRSYFPPDEHTFDSSHPRSRIWLFLFALFPCPLAWKKHIHERFFFFMSTTSHNREGTSKEETRSRLCRSTWRALIGRFLEGLASSFSKQRLFASR